MKKLFLVSILLLTAVFTFSQTAKVDGNRETLKTAVETGVFEIYMPSSVSEEDVEKNKGYYTDYFSVSYEAAGQLATIEMIDNSAKGRRVITRLLLSLSVKEVSVDGKNYSLNDFYNTFLQ